MATPTQADLDYLAAHPEVADKFRTRFGSLPTSGSSQPSASGGAATVPRARSFRGPTDGAIAPATDPPRPAGSLPPSVKATIRPGRPITQVLSETRAPTRGAPTPTQQDIDYLTANPSVRAKFEARFGPADRFLGKTTEQSRGPSFGEWAADQGSFIGKRALNAALSIPGLPADLVNLMARNIERPEFVPVVGGALALEKARMAREGQDSMVPLGGENIRSAFADISGGRTTPRAPRNRAEEYAGAVADFAGGSVATGAGVLNLARGAAARGTAGPVLRSIAANPSRFIAAETAAATGAGIGSEAARDIAPGSAAAPIIGALAGAVAPGTLARLPGMVSQTGKMMVRGGEAGRQRLQQAIADFDRAGTSPTVAQGTQGTLTQYGEAALRYVPGAMGRIRRAAEEQAQAMGTRVREMADNLSPNADEVAAGQAVARGITGPGGFMEGFQRASGRLYTAFDQMMPAQTPVTPARTLSELSQISAPIANAPAVSGVVANSRIGQVARAIADDVAANGGVLPYESLKQLRSWVGRQLATPELVSELPRAQLRRVYGALSDDMRNAAAAQGPGALRAFERANRHYQSGIARIDNHLERLTKAGAEPEKIFEALWRGREGETFLARVRRSVPAHEWQTVAATALRRLGQASDSAQNAAGTVWSPETFLTRWNQLSPGARQSLFGGFGSLRQDLDAIARTAERMRAQAGILRNSSGTAPATIATGTALTAAGMAISGNVPGLVALGTGMLLSNVSARLMTSPRFVRWLAQGMNSHPRYMPVMIAQLSAIATQQPELREDIARYIEGFRERPAPQPSTGRPPPR